MHISLTKKELPPLRFKKGKKVQKLKAYAVFEVRPDYDWEENVVGEFYELRGLFTNDEEGFEKAKKLMEELKPKFTDLDVVEFQTDLFDRDKDKECN